MNTVNDLAKKARQARREAAKRSIFAFADIYLKEHINTPLCDAQKEILTLMMASFSQRGTKVALAAPRGFGKSTLVSLIGALYAICYGVEHFIVIVSNTSSQSAQILENIIKELNSNSKLRADFPELAGKRPSPWTRHEIVTPTGIRVSTFGVEQNLRGWRFGKYRPTLVIADDLEKVDYFFNPGKKEKLRNFYEHVVLEMGDANTNYLFVGNFYHPECLLGDYLNPEMNRNWIKKIYSAIVSWPESKALLDQWSKIYNHKEKYNLQTGIEAARAFYRDHESEISEGVKILWPGRWTFLELYEKYEQDPVKFNCEYQNTPINLRDCFFKVDTYHYWNDRFKSVEDLLKSLEGHVEFVGACDPALGSKGGDYSAIIILAKDTKDDRLYHVYSDIDRMDPDATMESIIACFKRFKISKFGIESNQFQEMMFKELEKRSRERGCYTAIERIKNQKDKMGRIQTLQPLLKNGTILLNRDDKAFMEQLRYFSKAKYDDALDAMQMAVDMAEDTFQGSLTIVGGDDNNWVRDYRRNFGWNI